MDYTIMTKFLKPKQIEILNEVLKKQVEKEFIELCKSSSMCPECGSETVVEINKDKKNRYHYTRYCCTKCGHITVGD